MHLAAPAHSRLWHHPEMPDSANYFRLPVHCGPKQTFRLTGRCQFDMLRGSLGWWGPYAARSMKRREFITLLGGASAWPLAVRAQQNVQRIGVLMTLPESSQEGQAWITAFRGGLQNLGWSESRNIRIDTRWGATDAASQRLAREVITNHPDLVLGRSCRQWPRCEPAAAGRQRHRVHQHRGLDER
jgi:hypothetical protein